MGVCLFGCSRGSVALEGEWLAVTGRGLDDESILVV